MLELAVVARAQRLQLRDNKVHQDLRGHVTLRTSCARSRLSTTCDLIALRSAYWRSTLQPAQGLLPALKLVPLSAMHKQRKARYFMKIFARLSVVALVWVVVAMCAISCAPSIQDMNLSPEVYDRLPEEKALRFLQTLRPSPLGYVHCGFEKDGVVRWLPHRRQVLAGKSPFSALVARPERPGIMIVIVLYQGGQPWCIIPAESNADRRDRGDYKKFTGKILTALLSLGVEVQSDGKRVMRSPRQLVQ